MLRIVHTVLCFGLNILIERLGPDPRWKYVVIGLLVLNEIRGATFAYQFLSTVWSNV